MWVKVEVRLIRIGQGDTQLACLAKRLSGLELNCWVAKLAFFPVWPNGWVFVYELSGSGFQSSCSHLNFRFHTYFEQGFPWHSGNYRVWIQSEMRMWHDKNIQSNASYRYILRTQLNHLANFAKSLSVCLQTKWFWVWVQWQSLRL